MTNRIQELIDGVAADLTRAGSLKRMIAQVDGDYAFLANRIKTAIEMAAQEYGQEQRAAGRADAWISIDERIPDPGFYDVFRALLNQRITMVKFDGENWGDCLSIEPMDFVTHWMPMPTLPQSQPISNQPESGEGDQK